jgi:hypothetical protein
LCSGCKNSRIARKPNRSFEQERKEIEAFGKDAKASLKNVTTNSKRKSDENRKREGERNFP